jgi:hypothetical protein
MRSMQQAASKSPAHAPAQALLLCCFCCLPLLLLLLLDHRCLAKCRLGV